MVEITKMYSERLYLQKEDDNDIFVNNCQLLKQHQLDAIRFLFLHFKKKKPGVIVNFPSNCGKSVTVTLFLCAVRDLLKKPVLILCNNNDTLLWKELFLKWTEYKEDDIILDSPKLVKGKKLFIAKSCLIAYQHYSWSIIIVKADNVSKDFCWALDGDFKIWATSTDVKKDLSMLSHIYQWMYPKVRLNIKDFVPDRNNKRDIYMKTIYLDSFLEEFVIREDKVKAFNSKKTSSTSIEDIQNDIPAKKSRKNKDATGTKIKRSRKTDNTNTNIQTTDKVENDSENFVFIENELKMVDTKVSTNVAVNEHFAKDDTKSDQSIKVELTNVTNTYNEPRDPDICKNEIENNTESMSFGSALYDIIKNENISENPTELNVIDDSAERESHAVSNILEQRDNLLNTEIKNDNILEQSTKSIDFRDNLKQNSQNDDTNIEKDHTDIGNTNNEVLKTCDNEINESYNNCTHKLSNLEESVIKKFKGSFLDSIF